MGREKADLPFRGSTFLEQSRTVLRSALGAVVGEPFEIAVSGPRGVPDRIPGCGPLSGIHAALVESLVRSEALVVVPVDMPLLSAADLIRLLEAFAGRGAVSFEATPLPCVVECSDRSVKIAEDLLHSGEAALGGFLDRLGHICLRSENLLLNCNTQDDYRLITAGG